MMAVFLVLTLARTRVRMRMVVVMHYLVYRIRGALLALLAVGDGHL